MPDPTPTGASAHRERITSLFQPILERYAASTGLQLGPRGSDEDETETALNDLLGDLLHFVHYQGVSPARCVGRAVGDFLPESRFVEETGEDPRDGGAEELSAQDVYLFYEEAQERTEGFIYPRQS